MSELSIENPTQILVQGVQDGDLGVVQDAFRKNVDLTVLTLCRDGIKRTLLGLTAFLGHDHLVAPLVSAGVDVNGRGSRGIPPLVHAAREKNRSVFRELVKAGADINIRTLPNIVSNSVLHTSTMRGDEESTAFLLEQEGVIVSPQDDNGYTPLHVAARINHIPIINLLVNAGADLTLLTNQGWTPLHVASMSGSLDAVKRLLELRLDVYAVDKEGRTPCDLADELGMIDVYWFFIKKAGQAENTTLTPPQKCEERYEIEKMMLEWAADGSDVFLPMLQQNQPDPFDGYFQDKNGYTSLHIAAEKGYHKVVKVLLEQCFIYPGVRDRKNRTPADLARAQGYHDLAQFIESHFTYPQTHQEAESLYLELLELIGQGDDVVAASRLLFRGAPIEPFGQHSSHALIVAITANRRRILTLLLAAGAPITTTFQGLNILQIAWVSPHVSTYIRMIVTRITAHVLEEELGRAESESTELHKGIGYMLEKVKSNTPWMARWPGIGSPVCASNACLETLQHFHSSSESSVHLTHLMMKAIELKCSLTTEFLQQAGAIPFALDDSGVSPFTVALKCHHLDIARQIAKQSACLYIPDRSGFLPSDILPGDFMRKLENEIFDKELRKLDEEEEKAKENDAKVHIKKMRILHKYLYDIYTQKECYSETINTTLGAQALLLASQLGLSQLVYLLLEVAHLNVNLKLETHMGTTALHQAAAFGHSGLCALLISRGAQIYGKDHFQHTPPHLAAMFGHETAYQQLHTFLQQEPVNLMNNTPRSIRNNFYTLLHQYNVLEDFLQRSEDIFACNDPAEAERKKLDELSLSNIVRLSHSLCVDFHEGEAAAVKTIVVNEIEKLKDRIAQVNPIFTGTLNLLGSAADNTRLNAPDEFDFNLCVDLSEKLNVSVTLENDKEKALLKGHSKDLEVSSDDTVLSNLLQQSNWKNNFYATVVKCLETHSFSDSRLSLVPPGVTRTQVGVGLSLSWQGREYPLLLIGIDLVPVLKASWPENLERPYLTPRNVSHVYISSIGDGEWRLSFANHEAEILKNLQRDELDVYITSKTLLSCMKAEPWMPKAIKNKFTWWNSRRWKIPIPSGFALKNCFLRELEKKKQSGTTWKTCNLPYHMSNVFKLMVEEEFYEVTGITGLVSKKIYAYFGGEFEKPKLGEGSLEIIRYLEKYCKQQS